MGVSKGRQLWLFPLALVLVLVLALVLALALVCQLGGTPSPSSRLIANLVSLEQVAYAVIPVRFLRHRLPACINLPGRPRPGLELVLLRRVRTNVVLPYLPDLALLRTSIVTATVQLCNVSVFVN